MAQDTAPPVNVGQSEIDDLFASMNAAPSEPIPPSAAPAAPASGSSPSATTAVADFDLAQAISDALASSDTPATAPPAKPPIAKPHVVTTPPPASAETALADFDLAQAISDALSSADPAPAPSPRSTLPPAAPAPIPATTPSADATSPTAGYVNRTPEDLQREIEALFQSAEADPTPAPPPRAAIPPRPVPPVDLPPSEDAIQSPDELAASITAALEGAFDLGEKQTENTEPPAETRAIETATVGDNHDSDLESKLSEAEDVLEKELAALAKDEVPAGTTESAEPQGEIAAPAIDESLAGDVEAPSTEPTVPPAPSPARQLPTALRLPADLLLMTAQAADIPFATLDSLYKKFMAVAALILITSGLTLCCYSWFRMH